MLAGEDFLLLNRWRKASSILKSDWAWEAASSASAKRLLFDRAGSSNAILVVPIRALPDVSPCGLVATGLAIVNVLLAAASACSSPSRLLYATGPQKKWQF